MADKMSRRCFLGSMMSLLFSATGCGGGGGSGGGGASGGALPAPEPTINDKQQALNIAVNELAQPYINITATPNTNTWINLQYQNKDVITLPECGLSQIRGVDAWLKSELFPDDVNTTGSESESGYTPDELDTKNRAMADPNIYRNVVKIFSVRPGMTESGIRADIRIQVGIFTQQLQNFYGNSLEQIQKAGYEKCVRYLDNTHKTQMLDNEHKPQMIIYRPLQEYQNKLNLNIS